MKLRFLFATAALAATILTASHAAAQYMPAYGMAGGYQPMAPGAYPAGYGAVLPPQFDVRPAGLQEEAAAEAGCQPGTNGTLCLDGCQQCVGMCGAWSHRLAVWGEFLYLRPRNAEVAYGVPINGAIVPAPVNPIQVGRIGMTDHDYNPGFRFGVGYVLDSMSSISAQYTWFESDARDAIATDAPYVIRSMVSHPGTLTADQDFLEAQASDSLRFDWVDVDYRRVWDCTGNRTITFLAGARGGQYNQDFRADFFSTGTETVVSEIDFYGAGVRLGLEGELYSQSRRWMGYAKTAASFVAGEFTADYEQGQSYDSVVVDTSWKAGRIVPMLDLELGVGWQSRCGTWRINGGYVVSAWYNTVSTDSWVEAVQTNEFVGLSDSVSFDGLVLRCEGRF